MLEILHHIPDVKVWEKNKFNLRKMYTEWKERIRPKPKVDVPDRVESPKTDSGPVMKTEHKSELETLREENVKLEMQVKDLNKKVKQLERRNKRLESLLRRTISAAKELQVA